MNKKKGEIKAIVFDVEGVLQIAKNRTSKKKSHTNLGVHEIIARKLGFQLDQYFDFLGIDYFLSIEGKISEAKLLENLSKRFNYPKEKIKELYVKSYRKKYQENKFLIGFAKKIKKKGFRTAILSDQGHFSSPALVPKKFYKIFNPVIISYKLGTRKPNLEIYKIILKKLELKPKEILFIDDRPWNLPPASKLGINTALFFDNKTFKKQVKKFGLNL